MSVEFIIPSLIAIGSLIWNYLTSKNLERFKANKEIELAKFRNEFEKSLFIHRVQFEKEFAVYKEVWEKSVELKWAVGRLSQILEVDDGRPIEQRENEKIENVRFAHNQLISIVEKNQPFYPEEIHMLLQGIVNISRHKMYSFIFKRNTQKMLDWYKQAQQSKVQIDQLIKNVCSSIRKRLESVNVLND